MILLVGWDDDDDDDDSFKDHFWRYDKWIKHTYTSCHASNCAIEIKQHLIWFIVMELWSLLMDEGEVERRANIIYKISLMKLNENHT